MVPVLLKRIADLEARLAKNSSNSDRPPSSDPPGAPPPNVKKPTGRKRGGQPGHKKHERALIPPERVDKSSDHYPRGCRRCGEHLWGHDPQPFRHQVIDIPRVLAKVVEYRLHALMCAKCGITTRAALPADAPLAIFGPRLQSMMAVCAGSYHMSKRMIEELVSDFFSVDVSLGSVSNLEQDSSEALAAPAQEAADFVRRQPVVHADETGWTEAKKKAWLWLAVAGNVAVFLIRSGRGKAVAQELLGAFFPGYLNSDRWNAYNWVKTTRRQLCWAHLQRHFKDFESYGAEAKQLGVELQGHCEVMFDYWYRVRDGTLKRASYQSYMRLIQREILDCLDRGVASTSAKVSGMCHEILKLKGALFTFVRVLGVEPTNNAAERALRPAVLWRKGSFGTDSEKGSRFVERILTVVTTLRLQKRNVLDFMTAACESHHRGEPAPSLLAITHTQSFALAA
jgi:transposase